MEEHAGAAAHEPDLVVAAELLEDEGAELGARDGLLGGGRGGGGLFSNPALVTCLSKAGVTITPGQRPNFQDPATQTALAACMSQLGIAAPGRIGAGAPNPTATP